MLYMGCDHAGFSLKERIKQYLDKQKVKYQDVSPAKKEGDDYPDIARKLGRFVAKGRNKGILICGSGIGVSVAANKIRGVRAAHVTDVKSTRLGRTDDDMNILCLGQRVLRPSSAAKIVKAFLDTPFSALPRHKRRIRKIE